MKPGGFPEWGPTLRISEGLTPILSLFWASLGAPGGRGGAVVWLLQRVSIQPPGVQVQSTLPPTPHVRQGTSLL